MSQNQQQPILQGQLLIASPMLGDSNFYRSVIYIAKHDSEGAFGLILNRPTNLRLEDVIEEARGRPPARFDAIYDGGPVDGPLLALHAMDNLGDECEDGIWLTSDDDQLMLLCDKPSVPARFFSGYSGWSPGQLEAEMKAGGWMVGPCGIDTLFGDPDTTWESAVKACGYAILQSVVPSAGRVDPGMN
jgi:putative transcriptional regulator